MKPFCIFTAVFFLMGICAAAAQDMIILRDGNVIEAKVTEISASEIKYKRFDHLDGPTIVVPAVNVLSIRYANGKVETFNAVSVPAVRPEIPQAVSPRPYALDPNKLNFGLSLNPAGFIPYAGGGLSLSFDFNKGRFNSKIDIRSGLGLVFYGNDFFGISSSFNYFHPSRIGGFYIGGMIEYSVGGASSYGTTHRFGLAGNLGYKFVTPSGVFFRIGFAGGYSFGKYSALIIRPDLSIGYNFGKKTAPAPIPDALPRLMEIPDIEMVYVPGGSFQMGSTSGGDSDERPVHTVTLTGFYIGKYEVTQGQYQAVMGNNPASGRGVGANYPVYYVSWYDALVFCNKLSIAEGLTPAYRINNSTDPFVWGTVPTSSNSTWNAAEVVSGATGYRLPTEAQWEYAAKGGNGSPGNYTYSGSNTVGDVAWYSGNSGSTTHTVGTKAANGLGIYDMSGNVWEWCWDWYGSYSSTAQTDPVGASSGSYRVRRGGYWGDSAEFVRSAYRNGHNPSNRNYGNGFRLVRP
jgi:formylglycine-generating enzyme required for sulfatase activity